MISPKQRSKRDLLGLFFYLLVLRLIRLWWGDTVLFRVFLAVTGVAIVAWAVSLVLRHLLWQRLAAMDPSERDFLRSEEPEIDEFWADRPRAGERHDRRWRVYRIGWALMAVLYPPIATIWIRTGRLTFASEITIVEILAMLAGVATYIFVSRWWLAHYRCRRCNSATVRLEGETPRFSCARCGIVWNLGNV